jgi:hypothetical protein
MFEGVLTVECVSLSFVSLTAPDHYYVKTKLGKDVLLIIQHFPCRFLFTVLVVLSICVLGGDILGFLLFCIGFEIELSHLLRLEAIF